MTTTCHYLSYDQTNAFSQIMLDYLAAAGKLRPFYQHEVSLEGIKAAIYTRNNFATNRQVLVGALSDQYKGFTLTALQQQNLSSLAHKNTFTITTAHQPAIFTGCLYFIYKIIHAIKLAEDLKIKLPEYNFVPVFYMGSEDADLEELGNINIYGEKLIWETDQSGAIGRMHPQGLERIVERLKGTFSHLPFGNEMVTLCTKAYTNYPTIQSATLYLINELFKEYGLLVLIPDNPSLKHLFQAVIRKELTEQFSHKLVSQTMSELQKHYKVQATGRNINLFYLTDDGKRERIEQSDGLYQVPALGLQFSEEEILKELDIHPERFSPNVILRGLFQEVMLPNVAFIGGGSELAYWLELKTVFQAVNIPYPALILRNSFLLIESKEAQLIKRLNLNVKDLFETENILQEKLTRRHSRHRLQLSDEKAQIDQLYEQIQQLAAEIDPSLRAHTAALRTKSLQKLEGLEEKMLRAEKRKHIDQNRQIHQLKTSLFPNNTLQERIENFMPLYARYGKYIIKKIYDFSPTLESAFSIINLQE